MSIMTEFVDQTQSKRKFIVINCENSQKWHPRCFGRMFQLGLQCNRSTEERLDFDKSVDERDETEIWDYCHIATGDCLPFDILDGYQGIIITGSHYNCRDREQLPWFDNLCQLIRDVAHQGKIYGGCFGCQIIACALGGEVDYNPKKNFLLKAENIKVIEPDFSRLLRGDVSGSSSCSCSDTTCDCLNLLVSHGDCVKKLPEDAIRIGTSDSCENEIFIAGSNRNIMACQSHPEFDLQYCIYDRIWPAVVDTNKRLTDDEVADAKSSFDKFTDKDAKLMRSLISNFLRR